MNIRYSGKTVRSWTFWFLENGKHLEAEIFLILRICNYDKSPDHVELGGYITLNPYDLFITIENVRYCIWFVLRIFCLTEDCLES
jgi:hypothetical protein